MSYLPHGEYAIVEERKITHYLLAEDHASGRSKATFFRTCGFSPESWHELALALKGHELANILVRSQDTAFGTKYIVDGPLVGPDGALYNVRSVWFIATGEQRPRLVTAHPLPRRK